jgi:hypothetical protein
MEAAAVPAADKIREVTLEVLALLGLSVEEMEVSLGEIDYLVELAQEGEVVPIDVSDPAGGFGPPDLWVATVVPAATAALAARDLGAGFEEIAAREVGDVVRRVGSPRARRELPRLLELLLRVVSRSL